MQETGTSNGNSSNGVGRNTSEEAEEDDAGPANAASVQAAVCSALKWMVVNEEICKAFSEAGGVRTALQACSTLFSHSHAQISMNDVHASAWLSVHAAADGTWRWHELA